MGAVSEPLVPLVPVAHQAMSLSQALRQAAIDIPTDLPSGLHMRASVWQDGASMVVTVQARNLYGVVAWEQKYDGTGRRMTVGAGVTF